MNTDRNAVKVKGCTYCRSKGNRNAYSICEYGVGSKRKLMKCRHCGRTYSETHGTLFKGSKLSPSQHRQIKVLGKGLAGYLGRK